MDMATALRKMGAPAEILEMFGLSTDPEEEANYVMRAVESTLTAQRDVLPATESRAEMLDFMRTAWLTSIVKGMTTGDTSFRRIAETMAGMQLRVKELEDALTVGGLAIPYTPEAKAPEGANNGELPPQPEGTDYYCPIHGRWE